MLEAKILIGSIAYEQTLSNLFPLILKKLEGSEHKRFAVRLLLRMGMEAEPAALGILNQLDEADKNEIICGVLNKFAPEISGKLNDLLSQKELGGTISFREFSAIRTDHAVMLYARHIEPDYQQILSHPSVQGKINATAGKKLSWLGGYAQKLAENHAGTLAKAMASAAPEQVERAALKYLQQEEHKAFIRSAIEKALSAKGIVLTLQDLEIYSAEEGSSVPETDSAHAQELFTGMWEDQLIDAIVAYLKTVS